MSTTRVVFVIGASIGTAILLSWAGPAPGAAAAGPAGESSSAAPQAADSALYFPPAGGPWETVDPAAVGWDAERLEATLAIAADRDSTGVVILHRGRILAERHWTLDAPSRGHANGSHGPNAACRRGVGAEERGRRPGRHGAGARPADAGRSRHRPRRPMDAGDGGAGAGGHHPPPDGDDHRTHARAGGSPGSARILASPLHDIALR